MVLVNQGRYNEAVGPLRQGVDRSGRAIAHLGLLALATGRAGNIEENERLREELLERHRAGYWCSMPIAWSYLGRSDVDAAFQWLDQAAEQEAPLLHWIGNAPLYGEIRSDARFADILHRIGLGHLAD